MTILAPIARVEEALGVDRIVDAANRMIGKSGSPGGSALAVPDVSTTLNQGGGANSGISARSPRGRHPKRDASISLPPIAQPGPNKPLTILDVGDSIGEDLGFGLTDELSHVPHVRLLTKSVGDTGLANLAYFNWIAELASEIKSYHPNAVAVMLGGNDAQAFQVGNRVVSFGTPEWRAAYTQRVGEMMSEATNAGIRMIWVGLPIMGPTSGLNNANVQMENSIYASQAKLHSGVTFVSSWQLFENAAGQYSTYLPGPTGGLVQARDADETHIDPPGGTDRLGSYVVKKMSAAWHIKL